MRLLFVWVALLGLVFTTPAFAKTCVGIDKSRGQKVYLILSSGKRVQLCFGGRSRCIRGTYGGNPKTVIQSANKAIYFRATRKSYGYKLYVRHSRFNGSLPLKC